jgi:hypothetical protein
VIHQVLNILPKINRRLRTNTKGKLSLVILLPLPKLASIQIVKWREFCTNETSKQVMGNQYRRNS